MEYTKKTLFEGEYDYYATQRGVQKKIVKSGSYLYCVFVSVLNATWNGQHVYVFKSQDGKNWYDTVLPLEDEYTNWYTPCLEVDSTGKLHLLYHDLGYTFRYATYVEGVGWSARESVNVTTNRSIEAGFLMLDSNNKPHIVFDSTRAEGSWSYWYYRTYYINKVGADWTEPEELKADANTQILKPIAKIDGDNVIHIISSKRNRIGSTSTFDTDLIYFTGTAENWGAEEIVYDGLRYKLGVPTVNQSANNYNFQIDKNGNIHVMYIENIPQLSAPDVYKLHYAIKSGGEWSAHQELVETTYYPSGDDSIVFGITDDGDIYAYTSLAVAFMRYNVYNINRINNVWSELEVITDAVTDEKAYWNPSVYVDDNWVVLLMAESYSGIFAYFSNTLKIPIIEPEYRGRIMICEYQRTISAEAGTSSTTIVCTAHNLNDADMIVNTTRRSTSLAGMERGSRKIVVDDENTLLLSDGVPILGQTAGDEIRLYKYIDRTDMVKIGSININLQTNKKGDASLKLVIPVE